MANERITLKMTEEEAILAISGGNPGAITACVEILKHGGAVDPDSVLGAWAHLFQLDMLNIWEEKLYLLWNDVCGRDVGKMIAVIRAKQLGLAGATQEKINYAIDNRGAGLDLNAIIKAVKERLPRFDPSARALA